MFRLNLQELFEFNIHPEKIMSDRPLSQILAVCLMFIAVAVSAGLIIVRPEASEARHLALALNWFQWLLFVVLYPGSVLQSGVVTGTQPTSRSHRLSSPARYWVGLVSMTIFWIAIFFLVTGLTWIAWYPYAIQ